MKGYGGRDMTPFILSLSHGVVLGGPSSRYGRLSSGKGTVYPLAGSQSQSGSFEEVKNLFPTVGIRTRDSASRSMVTIQTSECLCNICMNPVLLGLSRYPKCSLEKHF